MDLPTILCSLRALLCRCHSKLWPVRLPTMLWGILKGKDQALIRCHEVSGMSQWKYPPGVCCNSLQASFLCADRAGELQESLLAFHRSTQTQTDNVSFWREATKGPDTYLLFYSTVCLYSTLHDIFSWWENAGFVQDT